MASEEMERAIQFILEQQAQLTATVGQLSEKVGRNADGIHALLAVAEIQAQEIKDLTESVRSITESVSSITESVSSIDDRTRRTDERLDALITTVERYISERRDGKS